MNAEFGDMLQNWGTGI